MTRMRLVAVLAAAAFWCGACASTPPEETVPATPPGAEEDLLAGAQDVASVAARVRGGVDAVVVEMRQALAAIEVAQGSVGDSVAHVQSVLDRLEDQADAIGHDQGLTLVGQLIDNVRGTVRSSEEVMAVVDEKRRRLAAFVEHATAMLEPAPEQEETQRRAGLLELEAEARAIDSSTAVEELATRSDGLVRDIALLSAQVEEARRRLETELFARRARRSTEEPSTVAGASDSATPTAAAKTAPAFSEPQDRVTRLDPSIDIVEMETSEGTLLLQLFSGVAPEHAANFEKLVGMRFYDQLTFHRVLPGFVAQGGCPLGDGLGGPGWEIANEFNERPHRRGTLSMARFAHPDSAGSQFFICLADRPELDGKYTVFGRVIRGEKVLDAIEALGTVSGKPVEKVVIERVTLRPWREGDNQTSMVKGNPVR